MTNNEEATEKLLNNSSKEPSHRSPKRPNKAPRSKTVLIAAGAIIILAVILGWFLVYPRFKEDKYAKGLELGQKYLEDGDYKNAVLAFKDALSISDRPLEVYPLLARSALKDNDFETASEAYDALLEASEDKITPTIGKAEVLKAQGDYTQAYDLLKSLSKDYPNDGKLQYALNTIRQGNLPCNVVTRGNFVASPEGMVYFVNTKDEDSVFESTNTIYSYNENDPDATPKEVCTITGSLDNLNLWNNNLYFYLTQSEDSKGGLYEVSVDGGEATNKVPITSSDYRIYDGVVYSHSDETNFDGDSLRGYDLNGQMVDNLSLTRGVYYKFGKRCWTISNGNVYFLVARDTYGQGCFVELSVVNIESGDLDTLDSIPVSGKDTVVINGVYQFGDKLYCSFDDLGPGTPHYIAYDLDSGEKSEIEFKENDGLTVNSYYAIFGSFYGNTVDFWSFKDSAVTKTVDISSILPENMEYFTPNTMYVSGFMLSPTRIYGLPYVFTEKGSYTTQNLIYSINLSDWSIKEIFKPN